MSSIKPSIEQQLIIDALINDININVDSVAGSGKTTLCMLMAVAYPDLKFLQFTYNAKLKFETRERLEKLGIINMEVHSYHSFCVNYYSRDCIDDSSMKRFLYNSDHRDNRFNYDVIIIDEAQDITPLYYKLICKVYTENTQLAKLCVIGDEKQCIFQFNGSDSRFITQFSKLWNNNNYPWKTYKLSISYRLTKQVATFINKTMLHEDRIVAGNTYDNTEVRYLLCNVFSNKPLDEVKYYLNQYTAGDIFILVPSIKSSKSPAMLLENKIKKNLYDVPVYVSSNDNDKLNDKTIEDKLVFSTFHQTKGLERKVVIIFGFDQSYFDFFNKNADPSICPNELYVAVTRCKEKLTLIQHEKNDVLQFFDTSNLSSYCNLLDSKIIDKENFVNSACSLKTKQIKFSVTQLTKYLHFSIIDTCLELINHEQITKPTKKIDIPLSKGNESISEITGIAIPTAFEIKQSNRMSIHSGLINFKFLKIFEKAKFKPSTLLELENIDITQIKPHELLFIANCWNSLLNDHIHKLYQISVYDWLSQVNLDKCLDKMNVLNIGQNASFEKALYIDVHGAKIFGAIDCIDDDTIYEFKCVLKIRAEHIIQLAIYAYMYESTRENQFKVFYEQYPKVSLELIKSLKQSLVTLEKKLSQQMSIDEVGDIVTFHWDDRLDCYPTGEITRIYKTTGKIDVKLQNGSKEKEKWSRSQIMSREKKSANITKAQIDNIKQKINAELQQLPNEVKMLDLIDKKYILFNLLTGEQINITVELEQLQKIMETIIDVKLKNNVAIDDAAFINNNKIASERKIINHFN